MSEAEMELRRFRETLTRLEKTVFGNDEYGGLRTQLLELRMDFYGDDRRDRKGVLKTVNELEEEATNIKIGLKWMRIIAGFFGFATLSGALAFYRIVTQGLP